MKKASKAVSGRPTTDTIVVRRSERFKSELTRAASTNEKDEQPKGSPEAITEEHPQPRPRSRQAPRRDVTKTPSADGHAKGRGDIPTTSDTLVLPEAKQGDPSDEKLTPEQETVAHPEATPISPVEEQLQDATPSSQPTGVPSIDDKIVPREHEAPDFEARSLITITTAPDMVPISSRDHQSQSEVELIPKGGEPNNPHTPSSITDKTTHQDKRIPTRERSQGTAPGDPAAAEIPPSEQEPTVPAPQDEDDQETKTEQPTHREGYECHPLTPSPTHRGQISDHPVEKPILAPQETQLADPENISLSQEIFPSAHDHTKMTEAEYRDLYGVPQTPTTEGSVSEEPSTDEITPNVPSSHERRRLEITNNQKTIEEWTQHILLLNGTRDEPIGLTRLKQETEWLIAEDTNKHHATTEHWTGKLTTLDPWSDNQLEQSLRRQMQDEVTQLTKKTMEEIRTQTAAFTKMIEMQQQEIQELRAEVKRNQENIIDLQNELKRIDSNSKSNRGSLTAFEKEARAWAKNWQKTGNTTMSHASPTKESQPIPNAWHHVDTSTRNTVPRHLQAPSVAPTTSEQTSKSTSTESRNGSKVKSRPTSPLPTKTQRAQEIITPNQKYEEIRYRIQPQKHQSDLGHPGITAHISDGLRQLAIDHLITEISHIGKGIACIYMDSIVANLVRSKLRTNNITEIPIEENKIDYKAKLSISDAHKKAMIRIAHLLHRTSSEALKECFLMPYPEDIQDSAKAYALKIRTRHHGDRQDCHDE
jgi:hypothetical protein